MSARYQFIPWVRAGAASAYANADTLRAVLERADTKPLTGLPVSLKLNTTTVDVPLRVYGPGDVLGIDPRAVIRCEPPLATNDFEPNHLAAIEFDSPDFPWLFTPAAAGSQGRLRPWLCLVVVERATAALSLRDGRPAITADTAELPDLLESYAWAHAQVVQADAAEPIQQNLAGAPERNLSRVICPRRLEPHTAYLACVVPAFEAGRRAGLGLEVTEENHLAPAWDLTQPQVELPVYYQWEFATGEGGDFETLAALLTGIRLGPTIGRRALDGSGQPFGLPNPSPPTPLEFQGPLLALGAPLPPTPSPAFQAALQTVLNTTDAVTPPIYGNRQAAVTAVPADTPRWVRELNLDPASRAAAGLGARIVQERQEQLVASAWEQLGEAEAVRRLERRLEFGVAVLDSVVRRHLEPMDTGSLLQFLGPAQTRVRTSPQTLAASLATKGVPAAFTSAAFRRALRPAGTVARRRSPNPPSLQLLAASVRVAPMAVGPVFGTPALVSSSHVQAEMTEPRTIISPGLQRYLSALSPIVQYAQRFGLQTIPAPPVPFALDQAYKTGLLASVDPAETMPKRFYSRVTAAGAPVAAPAAGGTVVSHPTFREPMYAALRDRAPELLLPGVGEIPANKVTVLRSNARFIEAFMAGLNHELSSELLWREFPGELRDTYFQTFWEGPPQIPELHTWSSAASLGGSFSGGDALVLVIRGELLRRYPDALIYAVPAAGPSTLGSPEVLPIFRARMDPDLTFLGFPLTEAQARGHFFVIQEQPSAPRFGLDDSRTSPVATWNDLAWTDMRTLPGARVKLADLVLPAAQRPAGTTWAFNAAHMAAILRQRPVQVAFHADKLLPPPA